MDYIASIEDKLEENHALYKKQIRSISQIYESRNNSCRSEY